MLSSYIGDYKKVMNISYNQPDDVTLPYNKWYLKNDYAISLLKENILNGSKLYGKRIAYFGDSLMHGMEVNYNGWQGKEDVYGGIWKRLNEKYNMTMVANLSEGGTCIQPWGGLTSDTTSIAYKMANYDASNTDIILFTGGFNDSYKYIHGDTNFSLGQVDEAYGNVNDYSTLIKSLETAILALKNSNHLCKLIWIKTWKAGDSAPTATSTVENTFNEIEKLCNKYAIPVIDLYNNNNFLLFNPNDRALYGRPNYNQQTGAISRDYTHLSTEGYDAIMTYIEFILNGTYY
jgi:lysophospholipase L1-like esterase